MATSGDLGFHHRKSSQDDLLLMDCGACAPYSSSRSHAFLKLTADQVLVFNWTTSSCQANLLKTGQDCSETC